MSFNELKKLINTPSSEVDIASVIPVITGLQSDFGP